MIVGFWSWPAPTTSRVAIDQIGDTLAMQERMAIITGVVRSSGVPATDVYTVDAPWQPSAPYGFAVGDPVDIATVADESFSHTAARISAISPDGELISVENPAPPSRPGSRSSSAASSSTTATGASTPGPSIPGISAPAWWGETSR